VKYDVTGIDLTFGKVRHLRPNRNVRADVMGEAAIENELTNAKDEKPHGDGERQKDRHELAFAHRAHEHADG
jgi:hypothetical protein